MDSRSPRDIFDICSAEAASSVEPEVDCCVSSRMRSMAFTTACAPEACSSTAELISWVISFRRPISRETADRSLPYIVAAGGRSVDGVLIMDLTAYDIQALDRYEEVDKGIYERRPVEVEVWGCGPRTMHLQAQTYVAGPALVASTSG